MININNYELIPKHMMAGIKRYVEDRIEAGGFLNAVLCNDLKQAVGQADHINIQLIPVYVSYLYNNVPNACWGSREKVNAWLKDEACEFV
jgi:hypothetical protein